MYVGRRPKVSLMNPNDTYPSHIPTCIATMNIDMVVVESPIPPCVVGNDRYDGTQRFRPHHANIVAAFIAVKNTAIRTGKRASCRGEDACRGDESRREF